MATTEKGIYYPNDGTQPADVLGDMKKMAESIDEAINDNTYDDTEIKEDITEIKEKQETQNKSIEKNATNIQYLQEENANLKAQIPTGQAAGEEISLSDSAKMELVNFGLQGNSRQETRSGKNEIFVSDSIIQDSGINIIKKDGIITVSGTATKSIQNCYVSVKRTFTENYILSSNVSGNTNGLHIKVAYKKGEENLQYPDIDTSLKLNANDYLDQVYLIVDAGATINATIKLQLEKGEIATSFEEYGAMPSLDYLSEVEAVGDNINLFDKDNTISGYYNQLGQIGSSQNWCYQKIEVDKNRNIIVSGISINNNTAYFVTFDENEEFIEELGSYSEISTNTVKLSNGTKYLGISCHIDDRDTLKVEYGTVSTSYSPYGQGSVEIVKSNKNLINNLPSTTTINGITFTNNGDGTITINGTATSVAYIVLKTLTLEDIDYSISGCPQGGSNETYSQYIFIPSTGGGLANDFGKGATFRNSNKPTVEVRLRIASGYKANNLIFRPQLEKGAATNFVENESKTYIISVQKPFYKIGKYLDSFVKQDKKWYEQHYIKELILTGEEEWSQSLLNSFPTFLLTVRTNMIKGKDGLCNYFKIYNSVWQLDLEGIEFYDIYLNDFKFRINLGSNSEITTLEAWKAKVQELYNAGTPIKLYYVLETPELIECTEEQTQILEQIIKDGTYKEVTHFYTTEDLKPTMQVKYYKDLVTLFNKQAELESTLNNVQAQLLELGGN